MSTVAWLRATMERKPKVRQVSVTRWRVQALLHEIRDLCPDCVSCDECGHEMCKVHEYGDVSECTHHNLCAEHWPGDCRQCQDRAEADPDMWGDMAREGRGL